MSCDLRCSKRSALELLATHCISFGNKVLKPVPPAYAQTESELLVLKGFNRLMGTLVLGAAVVDNLPEVPPEKFGKLSGLLKKLFSQVRR